MKVTHSIKSVFVFLCFLSIGLVLLEVAIRIKNLDMRNYDVEMWRYSKLLKRDRGGNINHDHFPNRSEMLQKVVLRTNSLGLRGAEIRDDGTPRILFLGSSITMGWGVAEDDVLVAQSEKLLESRSQKTQCLNAGVGNYNMVRSVNRYLNDLAEIKPTIIVYQYFLRDAEFLQKATPNILLKNSQAAVMLWAMINKRFGSFREGGLLKHYKDVYDPSCQGFQAMENSLSQMSIHAKNNNIRIVFAMTPDIHFLTDYPFTYIHDMMREMAGRYGFVWVDFFPVLKGMDKTSIYAMPGDPHPNAIGHKKMAESLEPVLFDLLAGSPQ